MYTSGHKARQSEERNSMASSPQWRAYAPAGKSLLTSRGQKTFSFWDPKDPNSAFSEFQVVTITIEASKPISDPAPLVKIEYQGTITVNEKKLSDRFKQVYKILRERGEPWYKISAIPEQLAASKEIKRVVRTTLQHERNTERADVFKACFPDIRCDEDTLQPLDELVFLRAAGLKEFPLSLLRSARLLLFRDDASDFEREENRWLLRVRREEDDDNTDDEEEEGLVFEEGVAGGVMLQQAPVMASEDWYASSLSEGAFSDGRSVSDLM
ncbi:MAG: hypothetical protein Q9228_006066 [Teloschistes exilis]